MRLTRQDTILLDRNFNIGPYHVLREICQKFDRVSSVKRTSLYFKSRARPEIKTTLLISHNSTTQVGPQTAFSAQPRSKFTTSNQINSFHHNNNVSIKLYLNNPKISKYG